MEKLFSLPKISIKEMEGRVKEQRNTVKRYDYQSENMQNRFNHNRQIKITSPFYVKCEQKGKCECQFHRLKKQYLNSKKTFKSRTKIHGEDGLDKTIEKYSVRKSQGKENAGVEVYRNTITVERIKNLMPIRLTQELPSITPFKQGPSNQSDLAFQPTFVKLPSRSLQKLPTKKTYKFLASREKMPQYLSQEASSKINAINIDFINLISSRLQNQKYKQKYLKTLFGFIKYKTNYDKSYLYHSRAYLQNSLNKLLNHFTMDRLLTSHQLNQEDIQEIAYYMNCAPSKVKGILEDLAKVVSQMERKLDEIKKAREKLNQESNNEEYSIVQKNEQGTVLSLDGNINSLNTRNSIFLDPSLIQQKNCHETLESQTNFMRKSQVQKHNIRKSSRQLNDLLSTSLSKKSRQSSNPISTQSRLRKSRNTSQIIPDMSKSICSTVLGIVDECQRQLFLKKKRSGGKLKKATKKQRQRLVSIDDKYAKVGYQKHISKKNYKVLIEEIQRLDLNDSQRASAIFKALNIQSHIDNQSRLDQIIFTFKPLFNDKSLSLFLKQIVMIKDKRYIQKLQRQLDSMLIEIKKNDPRIDGDFDFLQTRMRPQRKVHPLLGKIQNCNQYQKQKKQPINHIIYYEAEQRIERHLTEQSSSKLHLEQAELKGVTLQTINPSISRFIDYHNSPSGPNKKSMSFSITAPLDHKKVLGYMKKHHEGAFNYLTQQFRQLNSYLHSVHE